MCIRLWAWFTFEQHVSVQNMAEQQPISAAIRPPLITEKPPVPWWKQRSKRQPRKVLVNRPRKRGKRGKAAGKNPQQAESQPQSTEGATQDTSGNAATNVPAAKNVNTFKRRRRKKHNKLLVLDSWINDGAGSDQPPEGTSADNEEEEEDVVVLDSWENENVVVDLTQQPSTEPANDNNCACGRSHGGHVTNGSSAAAVVAEAERRLDVTNNTVKAYGPPDQGLSANELKVLFQRKRGRGRGKRKLLAAPSNNLMAFDLSETVVKIDPEIKVKSPLLPTPLPLLGGPRMQPSAAPRTSTADVHVLKNLPPFSGLTSLFDSSLSDPVHVPPPPEMDYSSQGQPVNTLSNSYPSQSLTSGRPPPLLDSGDLTNRGNPFKDTITPPMPLRRVTPEKIGSRQDPLQQLQVPGYNASSVHTSSLNPNLTVLSPATANNRSFTRPPSKPLLPTPVSARSPPPTLRGGGGGGGPASRQLKITSFLSPPKKRPDDLVRLEPEFSTSLAIPSVSHVGSSTRPPPPLFPPERTAEYGRGATFLPPIASRDRHYPVSKLRDGSGVLPLSDQDSIFGRLDSSTKYHQSRLQFGTDPSQRTLELAPPLHDIHDDPFSRLGPSVTSLNALSMSQFGDSFATGGNTRIPSSSSETDRRRPHPHTDRPRLPADSMISQQGTDVVVKLEPGVVKYEDDPSFSPRLYQTRPGGLNVRKALNRFAPKHYQITGAAQPSTSFALVKQERDISVIDTDTRDVPGCSSGERFVDIQQDSVRNVQQISGHSPHDLERTVTEAGVSITDNSTGQDDADGEFQDTDDDELESNNIHIPLSRTGLKIVAIDCEMVGCRRRIPHEQLLASRMKGGIGVAQGNRGGGRGGLGVLLKTKMKPQVLSKTQKRKMNKEISVVARCSIIAYDGTVIYDKYINPTIGTDYTIVNYRTPWSGIRPSHMTCATPFLEARREILDILQRCIVIGHNIRSDLKSLEISGLPEWQIRDTSCHPTLKKSAGGSRALKQMAHILLGRDIQTKSRVGHCSVEDATATMDLYKLVELEWE